MAGVLAQYPKPPGDKLISVATLAGPSTYAPVVTGSPPTGGQTILASDFGLVDFDFVHGSLSDDGQYGVNVIYPNNPQEPVTSAILQWFTAATGVEAGAVDLSGRTVRLLLRGGS